MNLIVNAANGWAIGRNNELLIRIPADMKYFQQTTTGKVVVMGRKTLESFPGGKPLPKRTNIVLTSDKSYSNADAIVIHDQEALLEELKQYSDKDIFIIGGESVYRMMLPYCDTALVTKVDYSYQADTYFPDLDQLDDWKRTEESEEQTYFDLEYRFTKYKRVKPQ